jgi:hypothetical protein
MFQAQQISFSPIPNTTYTITIVGAAKLAAPATDGEASNKWMTDAERLIRQCAKRVLYQDIILDSDAAAACLAGEQEAYDVLKAASASMNKNGFIQPMSF